MLLKCNVKCHENIAKKREKNIKVYGMMKNIDKIFSNIFSKILAWYN